MAVGFQPTMHVCAFNKLVLSNLATRSIVQIVRIAFGIFKVSQQLQLLFSFSFIHIASCVRSQPWLMNSFWSLRLVIFIIETHNYVHSSSTSTNIDTDQTLATFDHIQTCMLVGCSYSSFLIITLEL